MEPNRCRPDAGCLHLNYDNSERKIPVSGPAGCIWIKVVETGKSGLREYRQIKIWMMAERITGTKMMRPANGERGNAKSAWKLVADRVCR